MNQIDNLEYWNIFTRKEEYSASELDNHDRFPYKQSEYQSILDPVVSKYLIEKGMSPEYPDGKKFAVCLTHDIDDILPPAKHTLLSSLFCMKFLDADRFKKQVLWKKKGMQDSPYLNFREIMELEQKYDAKSSFYFITTEKDPVRFRYNIEDIETELSEIIDNGFEVGLHGGYYAYNSLETIIKEKERLEKTLGKKVIGYRNHYLRFKVPDTWELLSKAGFKYDTTLGYSDKPGFRNGMCHPFKPYNLNTNEECNILEIPLVIMDGAMFSCSKTFETAWQYSKDIIDTVERYNGVITLLWHNNVFNCPFRDDWKKLYEKILKCCYEKDAWMTSGEEIFEWWNNESKSLSY
ncbi:polysaccharide deacetylase family protein [Methanohalophilus sp. DAL1]|uniref:polysaccharide deacetylase family protein n=1 Tax=Methanohalophilus sp. DAL1 TaxID=1864608 RepID=UPI00345BFE01